jgi:hypothetical protein
MLMSKKVLHKKNLKSQKLWLIVLLAILILLVGILASTRPSSNSETKSTEQTKKEYVFKELGVKVKLAPSLENLTYSVSSPPDSGNNASVEITKLHLPSYTALANKCIVADAGTEQSFAILIKSPTIPGSQPPLESLKQFNDFYIGNLGASQKDVACKDQATTKKLSDLTKQLDGALKSSFQSAQKI